MPVEFILMMLVVYVLPMVISIFFIVRNYHPVSKLYWVDRWSLYVLAVMPIGNWIVSLMSLMDKLDL